MKTKSQKNKPVQDTKSLIIQNAIRLFAKKGINETTFQEIAKACKLSQPAAFYYFKSKKELIEASIFDLTSRNYGTVQVQFEISDDAYTMLLKHFLGNLLWGFKYKDDARVLLHLYYLAGSGEEYSKLYQELLTRARLRMLERIMAGVRERLFSIDSSGELLAELLHDFMLGEYINLMTKSGVSTKDQLKKELQKASQKWNLVLQSLLHYQGKARGVEVLTRELIGFKKL